MKLPKYSLILSLTHLLAPGQAQPGEEMVKMCLFYPSPSGHARSDPIINQQCASDHVHTFYGPQNFHPNTSSDDITNTSASSSTTPFVENQSLYWHPSIYQVASNTDGTKTYTRVNNLETSPYYRWDNSVSPRTEAFPKDFRMIAYSDQQGAGSGGESGANLFTECCNIVNGEEDCTNSDGQVQFPKQKCDFVGMAFAMPTCWNGDLGIDGDHISHMAYTEDGEVAGPCPPGYDRRLPQIQLFVRIANYRGDLYEYVLSDDNTDAFHVDFMNGWQDGKLQEIMDNCQVIGDGSSYNPPCNCDQFLTENVDVGGRVCDGDVRRLIIDEPTDVVTSLPRGTCQGPPLIEKSWIQDPPLTGTCSSNENDDEPPTDDANDDETDDDSEDEDTCSDSILDFFHRKKRRNCEWVGRVPTRCNRAPLAKHCPVTCNRCEEFGCSDTQKRFFLAGSTGKRNKKRCKWVRKDLDRCERAGIRDTCRDACGVCEE